MADPPPSTGRDSLEARLRALADDPASYDAFTDELAQLTGADDRKLAELEDQLGGAFRHALDDVVLLQQQESLSSEVSGLLQRFASPAFLVRADGQLVTCNDSALQTYDLPDPARVEDLPFQLHRDEPLLALIARIAELGAGNQPLVLRRAYRGVGERGLTLALMPVPVGADRSAGALLFVIDPLTHRQAVDLISHAYGLSGAEGEILQAFGDGRTLPEIAQDRARSLATVRTQFQSLLQKTGVGTQAELMRTLQGLSHFVHDVEEVVRIGPRSTRRRFDVLRPGGRSADVLISGDAQGRPVAFLHGAFLFTFPPVIEAAFRDAGLCVVAVRRPGFGRTSPTPEGQTVADCAAEDLAAVLGQLGAASAPALAHSTGVPTALRIAARGDGLLEHLTIIGGMAPVRHMRAHAGKSSGMTMSLLAAAGASRPFLRLLISARHRMYMRLGAKRFVFRQYAACPVDQALAIRPDLLREYETSVELLSAQGYAAGTQELVDGMSDWDDRLSAIDPPIRILHGREDPLCPLAAMEAWAADRPGLIALEVLEGVGHYSLAARTEVVLAELARDDG